MNKQLIIIVSALLSLRLIAYDIQTSIRFINAGTCEGLDENSPVFNTKFISDPEKVRDYLINERQFEPTEFTTRDGVTITGLVKRSDQAQCTMILSSGFCPGRMTGLATFDEILKNHPACNIILYDARGKGKSSGRAKFCKLWQYGVHDNLDIQAGIAHAVERFPNQPVMLYGTCAGAFHSAHALLKMQEAADKKNPRAADLLSKVKGLIFDSGWASVTETGPNVLKAQADHLPWYQRYPAKLALKVVLGAMSMYHRLRHEEETRLSDKLHKLPCPMLVIHSQDDTYVPCEQVMDVVNSKIEHQENKHPVYRWVLDQRSKHAAHHLKHKHPYAWVVRDFIQAALSDTPPQDKLIIYRQQHDEASFEQIV